MFSINRVAGVEALLVDKTRLYCTNLLWGVPEQHQLHAGLGIAKIVIRRMKSAPVLVSPHTTAQHNSTYQ
jgi:hypothetical protein